METNITVGEVFEQRPDRLPGRWARIDTESATEVRYRRGPDTLEITDSRGRQATAVVKLQVSRGAPGEVHGVMARGVFQRGSRLFEAYTALIDRLAAESDARAGERQAARVNGEG